MVDEVEDEAVEVKPKQALSTVKIVLIAVVLASLMGGGLVGATMYLMAGDGSSNAAATGKVGEDEAAEDEAVEEAVAEEEDGRENDGPAQYHQMDPKFVVSFREQKIARFMQFSLQVMTRDDEVINQLTLHNPAIRSNLLLLFNNQEATVMNTREGKETLLAQIAEDINKSLEELADVSGVEAAYFDSFLIQ